MADKEQRDQKYKWIYTPGEVLRKIDKSSLQVWINRVVKFIEECNQKNRHPFLARFFKKHGLWIYSLREELSKGQFKGDKWKSALEKYRAVEIIIKGAKAEDVICRNIDKSVFAEKLLKQERIWEQEEANAQDSQIAINLVDLSKLLPHQSEQKDNLIECTPEQEDSPETIIDAEFEEISEEDIEEVLEKFLGENNE